MSVRQDKRGRWTVDILYRHADGREERVTRTSAKWTKRSAEQWERDTRRALADGSYARAKAEKQVPTLRQFSVEFMTSYVKVNNRESEQEGKQSYLDKWILPTIGDKRLNEIGVREIEKLKGVVAAKVKAKTCNNVVQCLRRILTYAREVGELEAVPRFKMLKVPPQPFTFLDKDEFNVLVEKVTEKDPQLGLAVLLAGEAGLRRGELAGLQWQDINFPLNKLTVVRALWRGEVLAPKGGRSRTVPLTARLARALKANRHLRGPYVLVREDGSPWTPEVFRWQGERAYRLASLTQPERPWHTLRHSFCSILAMGGASPTAIQALAGHTEIQTTMKYMHLAPRALTEAIGVLDRINADIAQTRGEHTKKASASAGLTGDPTGT